MSISYSKINNIHLNNNLNFTIALSTIASTIATTAASVSVSMNGGLSNLDDVAKTTWDNTTSKDAFKSYAISALTAGATQGITNVLNNMTNGAITAGNASNATLTQKFTTALYESAISTTTNTAVQSAINGDSFKDILKQQAINTGVGAIANLGAKEIGGNFKNGNINKIEQLTLHAGLGAITNKLTGNDILSGAVSGVMGEVIGEFAGNKMYGTTDGSKLNQQQKNVLKEIPLSNIIFETDSPYLTPEPIRKEINEPKNISLICDNLCLIKNISREEVIRITNNNIKRQYNLEEINN